MKETNTVKRELSEKNEPGKKPENMVFWQINDLCNFRCGYCFCGEEKLSSEHPGVGRYSAEHITKSFESTGKTWQIHMSGGEPFLYPDFIDLCEKLTANHYISINTNLSTGNVSKFADKISPNKVVFINAGYHVAEREKSPGGVEKFIDNVKCLQEKGFNVDVGYLTYVPLLERMAGDIAQLKAGGISLVGAKTFRGFQDGRKYPESYTEEQRELINKYALDPREEKIINTPAGFFGKTCNAGVNYFRMDPAGNLFRCSTSYKRYGNLFEGSYNFDKKPTPCPMPRCECPYEGFKYVCGKKTGFIALAGEVVKEMRALPARGITWRKVQRKLKERFGKVSVSK